MSDDTIPPLLPVACKDLAWARNLAAQMKEGHGRHVSSRQFRVRPDDPERMVPIFYRREVVPDRRIGTLNGCRVMSDPQHCEIGDLTQNIDTRYFQGPFMEVLIPADGPPLAFDSNVETPVSYPSPFQVATFERVRYEFSHGHTEIFWKRIS